MSSVYILVPGDPVAKGRPKFARRGAFTTAYTPAKTLQYEAAVKDEAVASMEGREPFSKPIDLKLELWFGIPASWSKKKKASALAGEILPTGKPDWENCAKAVCDAFNGVVWADDSQVARAVVSKHYGSEPCIIAIVTELDAKRSNG